MTAMAQSAFSFSPPDRELRMSCHRLPCKKLYLIDDQTGKLCHKSMGSEDAPDFMRHPGGPVPTSSVVAEVAANAAAAAQRGASASAKVGMGLSAGVSVQALSPRGKRTTAAVEKRMRSPGKSVNCVLEETGRLANHSIVSERSPDWMKSPFESNRPYFDRLGVSQRLKSPRSGEAAGIESVAQHVQDSQRRRNHVLHADTGQINNQTIVSVLSPSWMKSPFESNREYFEEKGVAQKLQEAPSTEVAGRLPKRQPTLRFHPGAPQAVGNMPGKRRLDGAGYISSEAPEWMTCVYSGSQTTRGSGIASGNASVVSASAQGSQTSRQGADRRGSGIASGSASVAGDSVQGSQTSRGGSGGRGLFLASGAQLPEPGCFSSVSGSLTASGWRSRSDCGSSAA
mmetsp:Transcript_95584/g.205097  ORF Transcript_95584/g.205097 Transcript_95584/m.205097 type:complete len:398 (-) Transcript_95584:116-1309(-)